MKIVSDKKKTTDKISFIVSIIGAKEESGISVDFCFLVWHYIVKVMK